MSDVSVSNSDANRQSILATMISSLPTTDNKQLVDNIKQEDKQTLYSINITNNDQLKIVFTAFRKWIDKLIELYPRMELYNNHLKHFDDPILGLSRFAIEIRNEIMPKSHDIDNFLDELILQIGINMFAPEHQEKLKQYLLLFCKICS